jgi:hypothetical protein
MKIRMLIDKIKADFLTPTKAQLEIELSRLPMTITYDQSLALFRNMVNQKHPPPKEELSTIEHADKSMKSLADVVVPGDAVMVVVVAEEDAMVGVATVEVLGKLDPIAA